MALDIATLQINVQTAGLERADSALGNVAERARRAESASARYERKMRSMEQAAVRVAGGLAGLAAAWVSVDKAMSFMDRGLEFNSSLEQSQIGMASLITSMVKLGDATGRPLEGMEKYRAAQGMAADLMKEIQKLGLETTATTQELVEGVQSIMGPALQAGMALKDIPKFAVEGAQAMQTLGVPLNQMRTELEALLSGNINKAQDILAPKLFADINGDLGEYIRGLKESGKLIDEIMRRLEPFRLAGEDVAQTWKGLTSNLEEALDVIAGRASNDLTAHLKESVGVLSGLLLDTKEGSVGISENFVGIAEVLTGIEGKIGRGILSAVQSVADATVSLNGVIKEAGADNVLAGIETAATAAAAGIGALVMARKAANAEFVIGAGAEQRSVQGLGSYIKATAQAAMETRRRLAAEKEAAAQALAGARAELERFAAIQRTTQASMTVRQAEAARMAGMGEQIALTNALTAAEARYAAAAKSASLVTAAMNRMKSAGSSLLAMLGGPWGAAFTAAGVAAALLATRQSEAEKATQSLENAEKAAAEATNISADASGKLTEKLTELQKAKRALAAEKYQESIKEYTAAIRRELTDVLDVGGTLTGNWWSALVPNQNIDAQLEQYRQRIKDVVAEFEAGKMPADKMRESLAGVRNEMEKSDYTSTDLKEGLDRLIEQHVLDNIVKAQSGLEKLGDSAAGAKAQVLSLKSAMAGGWNFDSGKAEDFIKKLKENIKDAKLTQNGLKSFSAIGKIFPEIPAEKLGEVFDKFKSGGMNQAIEAIGVETFKSMGGQAQAQMQNMLTLMKTQEEEEKKAQTYLQTQNKKNRSTRSSASAAKSAAMAEADYAGALKQTQNRIESLQQQLGLDKTEDITAQKIKAEEDYQQAISKTSEAIAKQVAAGKLTGAQASELKKQKELEASLEKQLKLKQLDEKQTQRNAQIAQGQIKFYKELGQLSGNYADTVDLQNQLLRKQAREYIELYGISEELVQKWLEYSELQNSRDPFDGAYRGLLKFRAEYSDSASQWENITYNFGKNFMANTRSMFDDFLETGKASFDGFKNLFKQLLKDLMWQAVAQPIVLSVVGGIVGTGGTASAASGGVGAGGGAGAATGGADVTGLVNQGAGLAGKYAMSQLGGSGGLMGTITGSINSAVANMFPSMFVSSEQAVINSALNEATLAVTGSTGNLGTTTFTSALGTAGIGAGIGAMASPFVNSLLGLENNTGSQVGSMVGGGLGTLGGAMIAASAIPGAGWIAGGLAALGSLLGGGIGSMFGSGKPELPELYLHAGANLWQNGGDLTQKPFGGVALFNNGEDYFSSSFARAEGNQGGKYATSQSVSEYVAGIINSGQQISAAIADTLGGLDRDLKEQYLAQLREKGRLDSSLYLEGENITSGMIENFGQGMAAIMQEAMLESLSKLNLTPLVKAADGKFANTAKELGTAIGNVVSFVNLGASIDDEEMRAEFASNVIPQMTAALGKVSLAPLSRTAEGIAVKTVDELSSALTDVFSVYDVGESIQDENIKKAYQQWAQGAIAEAFKGVDLSFLRVDFDQNSFGGLQQAYAAIQAWEAVQTSIEAVLHPATEFTSQLTAASNQFDQWIDNLRALGWQEAAISEVEAKRADYMRETAKAISEEFAAFMEPVSGFDAAMQAAGDRFDDWISNLERLGYAEEEIIAIEQRRTEYLLEQQAQLERGMAQSLSSRITSLRFGADSPIANLQNLLFQQANERESLKSQYGEKHYLYQSISAIQKAELASSLLEQLKSQRDELLAQEEQAAQQKANLEKQAQTGRENAARQAQRDMLNAEKQLLADRASALQGEISAANNLANTFRRIAKTLEEYRRDLWSGDNNLTGSRYNDAYSQFNSLYEKAIEGDEDAFSEITGKASDLLQLGREQLPERGEYNDLFYDVDQKLKQLRLYAKDQVSVAEKQASELQKQLDAINAQKDVLSAQLDALGKQQSTLDGQLVAIGEGNATAAASKQSLDQINAAILALQGVMAAWTEQARQAYAGGATLSLDYDRLLQDKAEAMNAGKTLGEGQTAGGWTAQKVLEAIQGFGMTVEQWYDQYGKQEGFVLRAAESISGAFDASLSNLGGNLQYLLTDGMNILGSGLFNLDDQARKQLKAALEQGASLDALNSLQGDGWENVLASLGFLPGDISSAASAIVAAIGGLDLSVSVNSSDSSSSSSFTSSSISSGSSGSSSSSSSASSSSSSASKPGGSTSKPSTGTSKPSTGTGSSSGSSGGVRQVAAGTGVYGSKYDSVAAILEAKAAKDGLTAMQVSKDILNAGLDVKTWYEKYGKAEGFACGGITPINRPFWVGEKGPELMMSRQQYGVLSHSQSMGMFAGTRISDSCWSNRAYGYSSMGSKYAGNYSSYGRLDPYFSYCPIQYGPDSYFSGQHGWNSQSLQTNKDGYYDMGANVYYRDGKYWQRYTSSKNYGKYGEISEDFARQRVESAGLKFEKPKEFQDPAECLAELVQLFKASVEKGDSMAASLKKLLDVIIRWDTDGVPETPPYFSPPDEGDGYFVDENAA